ncbi:nuclear-interacting 1 [Octopus vulgaris]|uniref:Nuclear-interacting 1 n=1 Tax=Octopus vulgaris TaxID=6645 RepID=A0AA36BMD3_OCTVU|nr:nuclear-interacting 1 [Octopus vulgaris]
MDGDIESCSNFSRYSSSSDDIQKDFYRSKDFSRRDYHRERKNFDETCLEEKDSSLKKRSASEKRRSNSSLKKHQSKTGCIVIKSEDSRENSSCSDFCSDSEYMNKNVKIEPKSPKYSSGKDNLMKPKVSRWESKETAISIKKEPRPKSHNQSKSPNMHHHHHHHKSNRNTHEQLNHNRMYEDRKREKDYKRKNAKDALKSNTNNPKSTATTEVSKADASMELSGKLTEHSNTYNGIVIKYNEPAEARKPKRRWRLYPFKGSEELPMLPIHRQSAYLIGRERLVADIPVGHPSCSKQHAILQFRKVQFKRINGTIGFRVRPYLMDLNSSNGTYINCKKIKPQCYVELFEKDLIKFGYSSREYILLHEESNTLEVESMDRDEVSD